MGEIATWSAVKTKVGLGKDSNECPTKAELLALSPTGTGESYIGLEISNASSYGNNETVQLNDIHKVTYKYTFTAQNTTLSFPKEGGTSTQVGIYVTSTKTKYLDGSATSEVQNVNYPEPNWPSWIIGQGPLVASENTTTESRSATVVYTQSESGKQISVSLFQAAGVETWEYTFTAGNTVLNFPAAGGASTPNSIGITSTKQRYINGKLYGSPVSVGYTRQSEEDWEHNVQGSGWQADENKSESSRSRTVDYIQAESGKKVTITYNQAAGVKSYNNNVVITEPDWENLDIPASGGAWNRPVLTISQTWGWNGDVTNGGNYEVSGPSYYDFATGGVTNKPSLGTTQANRTKVAEVKVWVSFNKTTNQLVPKDSDNRTSYSKKTYQVYQAANQIESTTQGAWEVSISANPSTFTEQGGTSQISASARAPRTNHWSSGATNAASDATGTPTLSIPTAVTGFSLSGTTLTVAENTTPNQRSVVVRATMGSVYKEVTVTQSAYLVEWRYTLTTSTPTLNFDALGTTKSGTISSYREKYINGSLVEGSLEGINIRVKSTSAEIQSATAAVAITMKENTTTQARMGTVVYEQVGSGKTITITCNQAAGTITQQWVLREVSGFNTIPAVGGQVVASVESGYYDVINGTPKTWHNEAPEVDTNPGWISLTSVEYANNGYYTVKVTGISNGSESSRSGKLTLTNSQKSLQLDIVQSGASIGYNYYFGVTTDFPSVAAAGATPKAVIKSRRHKVVNGVEESSYSLVETSVISKPNWTGTLSTKVSSTTGSGADYDVTIPVYENTEASIRRGTVVLQQGGSGKQLTLNLNQLAASITTRDYIDYVEPIPDGMFSALAQSITVTLQSYRETLINGKVTSKVAVQPDFDLDSTVTDWASVDLIGGNPTNYEYDFEVSVKENTTNQTRSGSVMFYNGAAEVENAWAFTQDAATISTRYEIYYRRRVNTGSPTSPNIVITDRVTEVELEGTVGSPSFGFVSMELIIEKIQTINGNPQTPVRISSEFVKTNNSVNSVPSGQLTSALASISEGDINDAIISIYNIVQNLAEYPRTHTVSFYRKDITLDGTVIGQTPDITVTVNPIPYTRVFEFGWKQEGSTITNITLEGDIYGSSAGSRDIISYASLRRNNVEFAKKYIKPTFIPPSEDWLQVIDNGQNSDNSYNYAFKALTNNEGDSARNQQVRFEQPGNGNQALYAYVSQDPMATELNCELGNYYSYGASDIVNIGFGWSSRDGGDTTGSGGMNTPGGYLGARISLPAENDSIDMYAVGKPTYGKPLKIKLSNIRKVKKISYDNYEYTGLSVGYSQQDYKLGIVMSVGMESYFQLTPSILRESGEYGGGIQIQVTLKQTYNGYSGDSIADITLTPKDSNLPTLYLKIAWGNP